MRALIMLILLVVLSSQVTLLSATHPVSNFHAYNLKPVGEGVSIEFLSDYYETRYTDPLTVMVRVTNNSRGLSGVEVEFLCRGEAGEVLLGENTTDELGIAVLHVPSVLLTPGNYTIVARACGVEAEAPLRVLRERTTVVSNNSRIEVNYSDSVSFVVRLQTDDWEPVSGREVRAYLMLERPVLICTSRTLPDGTATIRVDTTQVEGLSVGSYALEVVFGGDDSYEPSRCKLELDVRPEWADIEVTFVGRTVVGSTILVIIVVVDDEGDPVPLARVTVSVNGSVILVGDCDERGQISVEWTPSAPGVYVVEVSASRENYVSRTERFLLRAEGQQRERTPPYLVVILAVLVVSVVVTVVSRLRAGER